MQMQMLSLNQGLESCVSEEKTQTKGSHSLIHDSGHVPMTTYGTRFSNSLTCSEHTHLQNRRYMSQHHLSIYRKHEETVLRSRWLPDHDNHAKGQQQQEERESEGRDVSRCVKLLESKWEEERVA